MDGCLNMDGCLVQFRAHQYIAIAVIQFIFNWRFYKIRKFYLKLCVGIDHNIKQERQMFTSNRLYRCNKLKNKIEQKNKTYFLLFIFCRTAHRGFEVQLVDIA